jgi:hypothetical protein
MLNHLGVAYAAIVILTMMGCGSYSAPDDSDNPPTVPDSAGDTTSTPPPPGYLAK